MMRREDSGAVAIVVAISATLLFVFGAMAVDIGAAYSERRADQNSADSAALGGASALPDMGGSVSDAMRDAVAFVEVNLPAPEEGWNAAWAACQDPDHLAEVSGTYGECVSVSAYGSRIRVVIPTRLVPTGLAAAIGVNEIAVSAFAEAQIEYTAGADVIPFAMPNGSDGPELCIRAATPPKSFDPCAGPRTGTSGRLTSRTLGTRRWGRLSSVTGTWVTVAASPATSLWESTTRCQCTRGR
jgi:hypothetical protein